MLRGRERVGKIMWALSIRRNMPPFLNVLRRNDCVLRADAIIWRTAPKRCSHQKHPFSAPNAPNVTFCVILKLPRVDAVQICAICGRVNLQS